MMRYVFQYLTEKAPTAPLCCNKSGESLVGGHLIYLESFQR